MNEREREAAQERKRDHEAAERRIAGDEPERPALDDTSPGLPENPPVDDA